MKNDRKLGLDILRCIAILLVVFYHYDGSLNFLPEALLKFKKIGWSGVDLFFVLSGYLISSQWFRSLKKENTKKEIKIFFIKRFFRIIPSYYLILIVYIIINTVVHNRETKGLTYFFFLQNYTGISFFTASWSLCVEEHFYLTFPFISFFCVKKFPKLKSILFSFILFSPFMRLLIANNLQDSIFSSSNWSVLDNIFYYPTHLRFDGLVIGILISLISNHYIKTWRLILKYRLILLGAGILGLVITYNHLIENRYTYESLTLGFTALSISYGLILPYFIELKGKNFKSITLIAELSFSMYLLHHLCAYFLTVVLIKTKIEIGPAIAFLTYLIVLFTSSYIMFRYFERFFMEHRKQILTKL